MSSPTPGYGAPPKNGGGFPWLPVLLIGGVVAIFLLAGVVILGAFFARGFMTGYSRAKARRHPAAATATAGLTESYSPKNGLLTVRYPSDFAAKNLDDSTIFIQRNLDGGLDEAVLVAAVQRPISDDVNEFGRVLLNLTKNHLEGDGGTYRELSRRKTTCAAGLPGLQVEAEGTLSSGTVEQLSTCFAIHGGNGYEFKTIVPRQRAVAELPLLNQILHSTTLAGE